VESLNGLPLFLGAVAGRAVTGCSSGEGGRRTVRGLRLFLGPVAGAGVYSLSPSLPGSESDVMSDSSGLLAAPLCAVEEALLLSRWLPSSFWAAGGLLLRLPEGLEAGSCAASELL
jgi:hypothetical protein